MKSFLLVLAVISIASLSQSLVCPDSSKCKDGMTCCKWSAGSYGCCPLESAQCCADGLHCCPNGTKCNDKEGTCDQISASIVRPLVDKTRVKPMVSLERGLEIRVNQVCPGGQYQCPDSDTCCRMSGTEWGCCPLENAVCCPDRIHCCPSGSRCGRTGCQY